MGIKVAIWGVLPWQTQNSFDGFINCHDGRGAQVHNSFCTREKAFSDHKITDLLYLCHEHAQKGIPFGEIFELISTRYLQIVEELGLSLDLKPILEDIREKVLGGYSVEYTASRGEYLNGLILSEFLGYEFMDPADMIFFTQSGGYDAKRTLEAVEKTLAKVQKAVIPGFYGSRPDGGIQTFSRGGSDITGAIIAQRVKADLYENWTDVSGFMMADPRIVKIPGQ